MEILRESSILQDLPDWFDSAKTEDLLDPDYWLEKLLAVDKVADVIDKVYETLNKGMTQASLAEAAMQKIIQKAIEGIKELIAKIIEASVAGIPILKLVTEILDLFFSTKEDILGVKFAKMSTTDIITTSQLYSKAVKTWKDAPRAIDSTFFTAFAVFPIGIIDYIIELAKEILDAGLLKKTAKQALLKTIKLLKKYAADHAKASLQISTISTIERNSKWLYVIDFSDPPAAILSPELYTKEKRKVELTFIAKEGKKDVTSSFIKDGYSTDIWPALTKQRIIPLRDIFKDKSVIEKYAEGGYKTTVYAKLGEQLVPIRIKELDISETDRWSGFSMDALFPELADLRTNIEKQIEEMLDAYFGAMTTAQGVIKTLMDAVMATLQQGIDTFTRVLSFISSIAKILDVVDIRYIVYNGDYTDLNSAWSKIKTDFNVDEASTYAMFNLVLNATTPEFSKALPALIQAVSEADKGSTTLSNIDSATTDAHATKDNTYIDKVADLLEGSPIKGLALNKLSSSDPEVNTKINDYKIQKQGSTPAFIPLKSWED